MIFSLFDVVLSLSLYIMIRPLLNRSLQTERRAYCAELYDVLIRVAYVIDVNRNKCHMFFQARTNNTSIYELFS